MGVPLFGQEHVDRYRETDGEKGHDWQGTTVLLLTTTGRNSGAKRTTPLIYQRHGDDYLVVASNGGGDPPGWFLNLQDDPIVAVQARDKPHGSTAPGPCGKRIDDWGSCRSHLGSCRACAVRQGRMSSLSELALSGLLWRTTPPALAPPFCSSIGRCQLPALRATPSPGSEDRAPGPQ
jgi:deazaflavin-dependent oxidoreductase (nitroreductase family)